MDGGGKMVRSMTFKGIASGKRGKMVSSVGVVFNDTIVDRGVGDNVQYLGGITAIQGKVLKKSLKGGREDTWHRV